MRLPPFRPEAGAVGVGQLQCGPVVDWRQVPGQSALARIFQLFRRLVAGIEQPLGNKVGLGRRVAVEPIGLAKGGVRPDAQPGQVDDDVRRVFLGRARAVGIVETQDELAAGLQREQPIEQCRTGVAMWILPVGDGAKRTTVFMIVVLAETGCECQRAFSRR